MGLAVSSGVAGTIGGGRYRLRAVLCDGFNLTLNEKCGKIRFDGFFGQKWKDLVELYRTRH